MGSLLRLRPLRIPQTTRQITFLKSMSSTSTPKTLGQCEHLQISEEVDDPTIRQKYRPFLLAEALSKNDWISNLELTHAINVSSENLKATGERLKILVLYGSLRKRSYSKLMAYEASRILHSLGCDVRIFNPSELPIRDSVHESHPTVVELRSLSLWSDAHVWVSPEQHGAMTAVFKNQIDWIPLSTGSVRPTQNRTLSVIQVNGGSQSFNTVNSLRILGRWMRMWTICNQSSLPMAWKCFEDEGGDGDGRARLLPSGNRDRLVDCMEELVKFTIHMRPYFDTWGDRFSERKEREEKRLKAEKEKSKATEAQEDKEVDQLLHTTAAATINGIEKKM